MGFLDFEKSDVVLMTLFVDITSVHVNAGRYLRGPRGPRTCTDVRTIITSTPFAFTLLLPERGSVMLDLFQP